MSPLSSAPTTVTVGHARERVNKVISRKTVSTYSPDLTTSYIGDPDSSKHHPRDLLVSALSGCGKDDRSHTGSFRSGIDTVTPAHRLSLCACRHAGAHKDALSTSHALLSRRRGGFLFLSLPTGFHQASLPYACKHAGAYRENRPLSIHVCACRHTGAHACYKKINGLEP